MKRGEKPTIFRKQKQDTLIKKEKIKTHIYTYIYFILFFFVPFKFFLMELNQLSLEFLESGE